MVYVDSSLGFSDAAMAAEFFKFIPVTLAAVAFIFALFWLFHFIEECLNPKSKKYRTLLKDMYVIGMIKKLATKEGIDLNAELKDFAKIVKKSEVRRRDLDNIVESELNEKIADEFEREREEFEKESNKEKKKEEKK